VANAVFDGTDAVMLSGETANGKFPDTAVRTMAAITANAENSNGYVATQCFLRDHSTKPFTRGETFGVLVASTMVECNAQLIITISNDGSAARMVAKYRPAVPQVVVTTSDVVANRVAALFGAFALQITTLPPLEAVVEAAKAFARAKKLWSGQGTGILLHGQVEASADSAPVMRAISLVQGTDLLARVPDVNTYGLRV